MTNLEFLLAFLQHIDSHIEEILDGNDAIKHATRMRGDIDTFVSAVVTSYLEFKYEQASSDEAND
jgi:hypothetical protein